MLLYNLIYDDEGHIAIFHDLITTRHQIHYYQYYIRSDICNIFEEICDTNILIFEFVTQYCLCSIEELSPQYK